MPAVGMAANTSQVNKPCCPTSKEAPQERMMASILLKGPIWEARRRAGSKASLEERNMK